jgi:hypothetical protein
VRSSAFDPALLDDQIRETLGLGGLMAAAPRAENGRSPITRDRDLEEMVQLYRRSPSGSAGRSSRGPRDRDVARQGHREKASR